ncbi:MAG: DUF2764 family protein [Acidobacteria bacterium]|nr:DUF2764 family protein [Acidobacteriota bacterium]
MITGNYYTYLIASLIKLERGVRPRFTLGDFLRVKRKFIEEVHWPFVDIILRRYDGLNLHHLLTGEGRFLPWGTYSQEELKRWLEEEEEGEGGREEFPQFMQAYLEEYKAGKIEKIDPLDRLLELYYYEALSTPNLFLRRFFTFEVILINVVTALRARAKSLEVKDYLICKDGLPLSLSADIISVSDTIIKNFSVTDFGLGRELPWIKEVSALVEQGDFLSLEEKLDEIKWGKIDELTAYIYFDVEVVLAYILKLLILERWREAEGDLGGRIREELVAAATAKEEEVSWEIG